MVGIAIITGATLGFASWIHCIGMCGPLVAVMVPRGHTAMDTAVRSGLYHAGRTLTYCILGLLVGSVADGARIVVLGSAVSMFTGTVMIALGGFQIVGGSVHLPNMISSRARQLASALQSRSAVFSPPMRAFMHGIINGLLPCGISLSAIIAAATLPSFGERTLFLVAFGVATSPALAGLALLIDRVSGTWQRRLRMFSAVIMVVVGALVTMRGMSLDIPFVSPMIADRTHVHDGCCQTVKER
ncbi:MAG: sulfite exporter TauE/SafE family protein [Candidatus Kapabacteria bacterium]|nr:sulfite exporter TauE/SafE family protein [Candidatus Kapabacteria bacterium]